MSRRRALTTMAVAAAAVSLLAGGFVLQPAEAAADQVYVYRVPGSAAAAQRLVDGGFDVLENRVGDDLFVLGPADTAAKLRADGFAPVVHQKLKPAQWDRPTTRLVPGAAVPLAAPVDETYYGGYPTVRAHQAHLDEVAQAKPNLATVVDYGDSWLKSRNAATGYDLKAICLTNRQSGDCALSPTAPKPRFFLMAQIHAREIATGLVAWRFIDYLASGYGSNAEVTALLNSTEVWVVPIVNPDGVDLVQQGGNQPYLQRKNLNNTNGGSCPRVPTSSSQIGVDLNRNNNDHWNAAGTSRQPCDQTYSGATADSEPETRALQSLFRRLYPDQRATGDTAPAPATAKGTFLTLHSYARMNLFPWGFSSTRHSGNDAALRGIAARMSQLNGYRYGQPGEILYNAAGGSDDWAYGELGVASFTTELASCGSFTPAFSCAVSDYNKNLPALMYLAAKAANPYSSGPPPTDPPPSTPPSTPPSNPPSGPPSSSPSAPPAGDAWTPGTAYQPGDVVTYDGVRYRCLQAHTALSYWTPPNVPALWAVAS